MTRRLLHQSFPNEVASIQRARGAAADVSRGLVGDDDVEVVRLLTSELVTNCVQHGHGSIDVSVDVDDRFLCVSVSDHGEAPVRIPPRTPRAGGHGLRLVEAMSAGWEQVSEGPTEVRFWLEVAD